MTDPFALDTTLAKYVTKPSALDTPELILAYGQPGCGKSYLSGTSASIPGVKKVLYLDTEGSTVGVLARLDNSERIDVIRIDQHDTPFEFLEAILNQLFQKGANTTYDVVVLDTYDVAQDWAIAHFESIAPTGRSGETDGFWVWGEVKKWSIWVAKGLKSIKPLGIMVVHDTEEKTKSGTITKRLLLSGKAKDIVPGIPDTVIYLERKIIDGTAQTTAYFGTDDNKVTKDRFEFPPVVWDVTLPALYKYIADQKLKKNVAKEAK
jgi:hypothetical protein